MTGKGPRPTAESEEHADLAYGKSYLEWKGWDERSFAKAGNLQTCYFDAELSRANFKPSDKCEVLEIGFGNGSFLAYAKSKGWSAVGTEMNAVLVEMATRSGLNAIHANDLETLKDGTFELVVAFDVLEHIPPDHLLAFVQSLTRLLKPGGLFLARFPNADSPFGLLNQNGDVTHRNAIGQGKVRQLNRELNLKLIFFGGQAVPLNCGDVSRSLRRVLGLALFKLVDSVVNRIFFPNDHISFCSSNVVMVLQAAEPARANVTWL